MKRASRLTKYAVVGAVSLAVGAAAVAIGAIPGADGTITGCYRGSGDLRVIDGSESCRARETRITWNQRGPRGDPGATGPAGPAGPKGDQGDPGVSPVPAVQYVHADLPVVESETGEPGYDQQVMAPLAGGHIPGWGHLEGTCVKGEREDRPWYTLQVLIQNESGGRLSVGWLDPAETSFEPGQEVPNNVTVPLAQAFLAASTEPLAVGGGASVVRRIDRKFAAFRIVQRVGPDDDHCEFDISMVLEP